MARLPQLNNSIYATLIRWEQSRDSRAWEEKRLRMQIYAAMYPLRLSFFPGTLKSDYITLLRCRHRCVRAKRDGTKKNVFYILHDSAAHCQHSCRATQRYGSNFHLRTNLSLSQQRSRIISRSLFHYIYTHPKQQRSSLSLSSLSNGSSFVWPTLSTMPTPYIYTYNEKDPCEDCNFLFQRSSAERGHSSSSFTTKHSAKLRTRSRSEEEDEKGRTQQGRPGDEFSFSLSPGAYF